MDAVPHRSRGPARRLDRRSFLVAGAAGALALACRSGPDDARDRLAPTTGVPATGSGAMPDGGGSSTTATAPTGDVGTATLRPWDFEALPTCAILPETTTGPFPLDQQLLRRDITEGYPGHPLRLGLRVVDGACAPVPTAAIEVWHADATGDYSAFTDGGTGKDEAAGTTFLRGTQVADNDGIVEFTTIYPGWYPGRAVHIHVRVRVGDETSLVSQLYFPDEYTAGVFVEGPYAANGLPDTTNAEDGLAQDPATDGSLLTVSLVPTGGTLALANIGLA